MFLDTNKTSVKDNKLGFLLFVKLYNKMYYQNKQGCCAKTVHVIWRVIIWKIHINYKKSKKTIVLHMQCSFIINISWIFYGITLSFLVEYPCLDRPLSDYQHCLGLGLFFLVCFFRRIMCWWWRMFDQRNAKTDPGPCLMCCLIVIISLHS